MSTSQEDPRPIQRVKVASKVGDPHGQEVLLEVQRGLDIPNLQAVYTTKVYRLQDISEAEAQLLAEKLLADPITETFTVNEFLEPTPEETHPTFRVEVGYRRGVMNPEAASLRKAAADVNVEASACDSSIEYTFVSKGSDASGQAISQTQVDSIVNSLLLNKTVQEVVSSEPETLTFRAEVGPVETVKIREASETELMQLSDDKLFLNLEEMTVIQNYFRSLDRDPTDAELEIVAARWSEHCGHKTFNAKIINNGEEKLPLFKRIKNAARKHFEGRVVSAFDDNSGVIKFYDGHAICGKVETHNSPSAIEPYGGAMTGSGGVFRDVMGTGQGAKTIISTDMFCFAPPDTPEETLPTGTLQPDYIQRRVIQGVRDYGNRMGIPTGNGSIHYHPDFRAKPTVIVGGYGILPESKAAKGSPLPGDKLVAIGGRTGRDGIHGSTFSSGEMTERTAKVNSGAVQIGNAIEQNRAFEALLEARDEDCIRALNDCGAAGFSSSIGEIAEDTGITVDLAAAPLKYEGLAPWEIWLSESQERMVAAIAPEKLAQFEQICRRFNVETAVLGEFNNSNQLKVTYRDQMVADLDYDFLKDGLPQRVMTANWQPPRIDEAKPAKPADQNEWLNRLSQVLSHGNVCSKEPVVRQYDHGVMVGNVVSPFGGETQGGPNDALVVRPFFDKPYGVAVAHGMNPILNRIDPYLGTIWAIAEAAANYVSVGGSLNEAGAVGNYIWPFPDENQMGSLDLSVDAATKMMDLLELPVISGKDSLSSTYRGPDGTVIEIPPVYTFSIFGPIADVEQTMTTDLKSRGGSSLYLVGSASTNLGGSTYYDIADGESASIATPKTETLPEIFEAIHKSITTHTIQSCHDVSEGGLICAIAEMGFGSDVGATINVPSDSDPEAFLFAETAGTFVVEIADEIDQSVVDEIFGDLDFVKVGETKKDSVFEVVNSNETLLTSDIAELRQVWQAPIKEVFPS